VRRRITSREPARLPLLVTRAILGSHLASRRRIGSGSLFNAELPLQYSSAAHRLATFGALVTAGFALACYQDKPPQPAKGAQTTTSGAPSPNGGGAQLGLQPVPATHDTAIREIDKYQLTAQGLRQWTQAKHALDSLHTTNPEIEERMKAATPPKTVDEAGKRFEGEPQMRAALRQAGISGKDFLLTSIALQQAMKGYQLKALGKLDQSKVPPAVMGNINFVGTHMPEIMGSIAGGARRRPTP
jgi:hypothetical protein